MKRGDPHLWRKTALLLASAAVAVTASGGTAFADDGHRGHGRDGDRGRGLQILVVDAPAVNDVRNQLERENRDRDELERNARVTQPVAAPQITAAAIADVLGLPGDVQGQDVLTLRSLKELSAVLSTPDALTRLGNGFTASAVTPDMLGTVPITQLIDFGLLVGQTPQQVVDILSLSLFDDNRHGDD